MVISLRAWIYAWASTSVFVGVATTVWLALFQFDYGSVAIGGSQLAWAALLASSHVSAYLLIGGALTIACLWLIERHRPLGALATAFVGGLACLPSFCGTNVLLQRFRWALVAGAALGAAFVALCVWRLARAIAERWAPQRTAALLCASVVAAMGLVLFGLKRLPLYPTAMVVLFLAMATAVALAWQRFATSDHAAPRTALIGVSMVALAALGPLGVTGNARFTKPALALNFNIMGTRVLVQPRVSMLYDLYKVAGVVGSGPPATAIVDAASLTAAPPPTSKHNVLLVVVDALRRDRMRLYGGDVAMPNIERLARRAMVHTKAYSSSDGTGLTMASVLSGAHPSVFNDLDRIPLFLPAWLRHHGYTANSGLNELALQLYVHALLSGRKIAELGFADAPFSPPDEKQLQDALARLGTSAPHMEYVHIHDTHGPFPGPSGKQDYAEALQEADRLLGLALDDLDKRAAWDKTIVIVTSDHGEGIGDHGIYGHSQALYEEHVGVPLVVAMPDGATGVSDEVVDLTALPTLVMAGLGGAWPVPTSAGPLLGASVAVQEHQIMGTVVWRSFRAEKWAYHQRFSAGEEALYDLEADPGELHDVSAANPEVMARFAQWRDAWLKRRGQAVEQLKQLPTRSLGPANLAGH